MKRKLALLLAILMTSAMLLPGCSSSSKSSSGSSASGASTSSTTKAPYTVKMAILTVYGNPKDQTQVEDAINKISVPKINTKIEFDPISVAQWTQQMNLMLASNEKLDLTTTLPGSYATYVAQGKIIAMDDLISQYGQGIQAQFGKIDSAYMNAGKINGKVYGLAGLRDLGANYGFCMRKDIAAALGIDPTKTYTLDQMEKYLLQIKQKYPNMTPTMPQVGGSTNSMVSFLLNSWDALDDGYGVLMNDGTKDLNVVDLYETDYYKNMVQTMSRWFQEGLIYKDSPTTTDTGVSLVKAGTLASFVSNMKPGFETQESALTGKDMVDIEVVPGHTSTSDITGFVWAIPINCKDPASTMKMLNLMYTDPDVANLLSWGIEGTDYATTSTQNLITYPAGKTSADVQWCQGLAWEFPNELLSYVMKPDTPDLYTRLATFDKNLQKSKALGFSFNETPVKDQVTAVTNVKNQYMASLEDGAVDPSTVLPKFISALKAAGIGTIIKEKQSQLNTWAKANNVS